MAIERELILQNVEETLKAIQKGDDYPPNVSGTYTYTPFVTRQPIAPEECETFPTYVIVPSDETYAYYGKRVVQRFNFLIRCYHHSEKGFGDIGTKQNSMVRDVLAAMSGDVSRGGNVGNTEALNTLSDEGWVAPFIAAEITFQVVYYTLELNR